MIDHAVRNSLPLIRRLVGLVVCCGGLLQAQTPEAQTPLTERERALLDRIESLEKKVAALEARLPAAAPQPSVLGGPATGAAAAAVHAASNTQSVEATKQGVHQYQH